MFLLCPKEIVPIIIEERLGGSIRLFPMTDYEISVTSQHKTPSYSPCVVYNNGTGQIIIPDSYEALQSRCLQKNNNNNK